MKRRGFLGFMSGAVVAGPHAAKSAIKDLPSGLGGSNALLSQGINSVWSGAPAIDGGWKIAEIKKLKALITGELSDEERLRIKQNRLYMREREIGESIASLVSVSGCMKLSMYSDRMARHQERVIREDAKSRLFWLERQD